MCCSSGPDKAELPTRGAPGETDATTDTTVADSASGAARTPEPVQQGGEIDEGDPDRPVPVPEGEDQRLGVDHAPAAVHDVGNVAVPLLGGRGDQRLGKGGDHPGRV